MRGPDGAIRPTREEEDEVAVQANRASVGGAALVVRARPEGRGRPETCSQAYLESKKLCEQVSVSRAGRGSLKHAHKLIWRLNRSVSRFLCPLQAVGA